MGLFRCYPQWRTHSIVKQKNTTGPLSLVIPYEFVCQVCQETWLSAEGISDRCPGLSVYHWPLDERKPAYLVTRKELVVLGFKKPKGPPRAYFKAVDVHGGEEWIPLYDQRTATA